VKKIGPYEVNGELARGAMGVVFRAKDPALDRDVAIKVMLHLGDDPQDLERFRREARATARLRHPSIVALHTVGNHEGRPYLVMDLVEGESLHARVERDGPLPPREAAQLIATLAEALAYAHAQGVIHRDVKPANVLLDERGAPLVTDFGLARREGEDQQLTHTGEIVGTPAYMSPEQAGGEPGQAGPASDVYGLGATLYELLTGRPPFLADTLIEVFAAIVTEPPEPPRSLRPEVPPELESICLRCLAKEPADRLPSAAALAEALRRFLDPKAARVAAGPAASAAPAATPSFMASPWAPLAALGLLALVAGGWAQTSLLLSDERAERRAAEALLDELGIAGGVALDPEEAELLTLAYAMRGDILRRAGEWELALSDYDRYLDAEPEAVQALMNRADVKIKLGDEAGALEDLNRVLELDETRARAYRDRAGLRVALHRDFEGALADSSRAIELDGTDAGAFVNRGSARFNLGDMAGAEADCRRALKLNPDQTEAIYNLGLALAAQGELEEAEPLFTRALQVAESPRLLLHRAIARVRLERPKDAIADLDRALELDPALARGYAERGYAWEQLELRERAEADWNRALELLEDDSPIAVDVRRRLAGDGQ
jgi:tetratricopeptide (TPR) repeat protein